MQLPSFCLALASLEGNAYHVWRGRAWQFRYSTYVGTVCTHWQPTMSTNHRRRPSSRFTQGSKCLPVQIDTHRHISVSAISLNMHDVPPTLDCPFLPELVESGKIPRHNRKLDNNTFARLQLHSPYQRPEEFSTGSRHPASLFHVQPKMATVPTQIPDEFSAFVVAADTTRSRKVEPEHDRPKSNGEWTAPTDRRSTCL